MKAVFGILSLVAALAVVLLVARQQVHPGAVAGAGAGAAGPAPSTASEARGIEEKARADVTRALQQGAQRTENADR